MIDIRLSNIQLVAETSNSVSEQNLDDFKWSGMDWGAPRPSGAG